ncbi:MAG: efflux RND transporter periplasmic adaptor subunit [Alphaproteobacteria bacterium]|nr:efflux RND transporter periplasmic adaptor subunit [Alphaproteobacteria bacterium]
MRNKRIAVALSIAVLASAGAAGGMMAWKSATAVRTPVVAEAPPRPARVQEVTFRPETRRMSLAGVVVPRIETNLGFRVSGKIISREVDLGARVKAGQVLARLDPSDLTLARDNAAAAVVAAEAEEARARADLDRYAGLQGTAAFVPQVHDQRLSAANTAKARLDQARAQLATAENNLGYSALVADAPGVVTGLTMEVGQVVAAGQNVARVARTDELEILVNVPEQRLSFAADTSDVSFELWAQPDQRFRARLRELAPAADPTTRTYAARYTLVDRPPLVALGMTATLSIERRSGESVAELPLTAIFQQGTAPAVWLVDRATGAVTLRPVTVQRWRDDTAVISAGVANGDLVVTAGVHKLAAGQRVSPRPTTSTSLATRAADG